VGRKILEANLDHPGRIVALEMGGNNPAVVLEDADLKQAAIEIARSAFVTTGQRCTCTRRLIVHEAIADRLLAAVEAMARRVVVGDPRREDPVFMGPIISAEAREAVLAFEDRLAQAGGRVLLAATTPDVEGHYLTPSMVEVDGFNAHEGPDAGCDVEVFGPLLRITRVRDLESAIQQANATRFGLAASIFTRDRSAAERFLARARAGCINVNTGTAGASSKLPFGGLGHSGNHRPAGSFSLDYCAAPVAQMIEHSEAAPLSPGMEFDPAWLG
jgi:succinylglutamic semialdehyde dehydrogenase